MYLPHACVLKDNALSALCSPRTAPVIGVKWFWWWRPSAMGFYYYLPSSASKLTSSDNWSGLHGLMALYVKIPKHAYLTPKCSLG